jgi:hypothetical protein
MNIGDWLQVYGFELNNREWASLIWLGALLGFGLLNPDIRGNLRNVLRLAFTRKLAFVWAIYLVWIAALVVLSYVTGIWRTELTKDTIVWTATAGLVLVGSFTEAWKPGHFKSAFFKAVGAVALLEYLVTLATFRLWVEVILQPLVVLFAVAPIMVKEDKERISWQRVGNWFFLILVCVMLAHTALTLRASWEAMDWGLFILRGAWPVALAAWVLIAVFGLGILATYEQAFNRLMWIRDQEAGSWKAKLGLFLALRLGLRWVHEAAKGGTYDVAHADSIHGAFQAASAFKREHISTEKRENRRKADLVRYAGSDELDENGRPRDKREFRETVHTLEWLHTCQMGWYRRDPPGYKPDLIERFRDDFTAQGIPAPSCITIVVSDDGERWYAWRKTPSGHCFAIGASEHPPDKWIYDGPRPPDGFPGLAAEWGDRPFSEEKAPNWYE